MIYQISDTPDLVVETDSLEYVKRVVRAHPNCSIRELGTGKVYRPKLVPRQPGAPAPHPAAPHPAAPLPAERTSQTAKSA